MGLLKNWRRKRIGKGAFPLKWLSIVVNNVPYYGRLSAEDQAELRRHILIFLSEKNFEGCGGLEITDEIRVTIAAQACILLLHRRTDYYPGLLSILVYPNAFLARQKEWLPSGVVVEGVQSLEGQSARHGPVVLSWEDVQRAGGGHNVALHEFAHQIDSAEGEGDSSEVLQNRSGFSEWAKVLERNYRKLQREVESNHPLSAGGLDSYGATDEAEFFAVATELFFERPVEVKKRYPDLYEQLSRFYHQDPAGLV